ncbi:MAG: hypothetical protein ACHQFW_04275, partial [Chitinophagales bacterium]
LMQFIGLQGIAYGTVLAFIVNKTMLTIKLKRLGVEPFQYIPVKLLSYYSIILILVFFTFTYIIGR